MAWCAGLSHLIGTGLLRAYMHGFFMDMKLYHKVRVQVAGRKICFTLYRGYWIGTVLYLCLQAKAIAQPFAYEEYRKEKIRKKVEEARASRIRLKVHRPIDMSYLQYTLEWDIFMRNFFF